MPGTLSSFFYRGGPRLKGGISGNDESYFYVLRFIDDGGIIGLRPFDFEPSKNNVAVRFIWDYCPVPPIDPDPEHMGGNVFRNSITVFHQKKNPPNRLSHFVDGISGTPQ